MAVEVFGKSCRLCPWFNCSYSLIFVSGQFQLEYDNISSLIDQGKLVKAERALSRLDLAVSKEVYTDDKQVGISIYGKLRKRLDHAWCKTSISARTSSTTIDTLRTYGLTAITTLRRLR